MPSVSGVATQADRPETTSSTRYTSSRSPPAEGAVGAGTQAGHHGLRRGLPAGEHHKLDSMNFALLSSGRRAPSESSPKVVTMNFVPRSPCMEHIKLDSMNFVLFLPATGTETGRGL